MNFDRTYLESVAMSELLRQSLARNLVKFFIEVSGREVNGEIPDVQTSGDAMLLIQRFLAQLSGFSSMPSVSGINIPARLGNVPVRGSGINLPGTTGYGIGLPGSVYGINIPGAMYGLAMPGTVYESNSAGTVGNVQGTLYGLNMPNTWSFSLLQSTGLNVTSTSNVIGFLLLENTVRSVFDNWLFMLHSDSTDGVTRVYVEEALRSYYGNETMDLIANEIRERQQNPEEHATENFLKEVLTLLNLHEENVEGLVDQVTQARYAYQKDVMCSDIFIDFQCLKSGGHHRPEMDIEATVKDTSLNLLTSYAENMCHGKRVIFCSIYLVLV